MSTSKTVTRTFSLKKKYVDALEKEAHRRGISTSALMNQTLDRIVKQVWPGEIAGVMSIGRYVIRDLLDNVSDEELKKVAGSAVQQHKTRAFLYGTEQRLDSVLEMMSEITGPYFGWFTFVLSTIGRDHKILLTHTLGKNGVFGLMFILLHFS
jgi:hypothetical protein